MTRNSPLAIRRASFALAMVLIGLGGSAAEAEAEVEGKTMLRWKFKEGDVLRYSLDQTTVSIGQDPTGREIKQTIGLVMDMTWTIKSVDATGVASMTQTIDRVRTSASLPFGKFSFDSKEAGDASSVAGPLFKMLVGAEFSSRMTPRGEVNDIKLSDKLLATLRGTNEPAGAQGQFSEAGLKNMLAQLVIPMPEEAVDVGQTWRKSMAIPAGPEGQTRQIEQTFTYKGPGAASNSLVSIGFTTRFDPPKTDPNVPVTLKKEAATGRYDFDNASGRIVHSDVDENVELSISLEGKEIPQKVETRRTLVLSKDKSP